MASRLAAAILLASIFAGCADPQGSSQYRELEGGVRLETPQGWREIDAPDGADALVIASPSMISRQEDCRATVVVFGPSPLPHDQLMFNDGMANLTAEGMFGPAVIVHSFKNDVIKGVRVVSYDVERGGMRLMESLFRTSRTGVRTEYAFSCEVLATDKADIDASQRWLGSLDVPD